MSMYLGNSACISFQNTITGEKFGLVPLQDSEAELVQPAYKELLKPALLRRMSKVLKMGNYCAKAVLKTGEDSFENPDAVVVGTGLGCIRDTIGFLDEVLRNDEQTLAPTAFIQSTHNSIAGQIALMLQNYQYNMTLVQKSLSFEMALLDAELQLSVGNQNQVLVGAADELTPELINLLNALADEMKAELPQLGEGAAFFSATSTKSDASIAKVVQIATSTRVQSTKEFLSKNNLNPNSFDLILRGNHQLANPTIPEINFKQYFGEFFTVPALATHLALEIFKGNVDHPSIPHSVNRILILNTFGGHYGAIVLESL